MNILAKFVINVRNTAEAEVHFQTKQLFVGSLSEKKVQKLSLGQYLFKRYTFVPYLPLKVHIITKVYILVPKWNILVLFEKVANLCDGFKPIVKVGVDKSTCGKRANVWSCCA